MFLGMDQPLENIVIDDSERDTIASKHSPCAWYDLYSPSPDVAQFYLSLHRCTLSTQATTEILLCPPSPASSSTGASGVFLPLTSPSSPSSKVWELFPGAAGGYVREATERTLLQRLLGGEAGTRGWANTLNLAPQRLRCQCCVCRVQCRDQAKQHVWRGTR